MGPDLIAYDIIYLMLKDFLENKLTIKMYLLQNKVSNKYQLFGLLSDGKRVVVYFPTTVMGINVSLEDRRINVPQDWYKQNSFKFTTVNECLDATFIHSILTKMQLDSNSTDLGCIDVIGVGDATDIKSSNVAFMRNKLKEFVASDLTSITYFFIFNTTIDTAIVKAISLCKHTSASRIAVLITHIIGRDADDIDRAFEHPGAVFTLFKTGEVLSKRFIENFLEDDVGGRHLGVKELKDHYHLTPQQVKELTDEFPSKYYKFRGIDVEE